MIHRVESKSLDDPIGKFESETIKLPVATAILGAIAFVGGNFAGNSACRARGRTKRHVARIELACTDGYLKGVSKFARGGSGRGGVEGVCILREGGAGEPARSRRARWWKRVRARVQPAVSVKGWTRQAGGGGKGGGRRGGGERERRPSHSKRYVTRRLWFLSAGPVFRPRGATVQDSTGFP